MTSLVPSATILTLMEIKYLGHSSFVLRSSKASVITDPFDIAMTGLKFPAVSSDIVTISHDHDDHSKSSIVGGSPVVFDMPGEYEVLGIRIYGYPTFHDNKNGSERGMNTVFKFVIDEVKILHCGDLGHVFSEDQLSQIGSVDVLLIPVGGHFTIGAEEGAKVVSQIEPSIVVPMHFKTERHSSSFDSLSTIDDFVKQMGGTAVQEKKLVVKPDGLAEETKVVALEVSS